MFAPSYAYTFPFGVAGTVTRVKCVGAVEVGTSSLNPSSVPLAPRPPASRILFASATAARSEREDASERDFTRPR
jgi:hypothetical protein